MLLTTCYLPFVHQAKDVSERKAKEATLKLESLTAELQREKQLNISSTNLAKKAARETKAIKRAVQSLGCNIHFSNSGELTVDIEGNQKDVYRSVSSPPRRELGGQLRDNDKSSDLSVSLAVTGEDQVSNNSVNRVCESLCPLRSRDGGCHWPDAGCAQFGSQFIGLKANFDAFDRLSIYEKYFESE